MASVASLTLVLVVVAVSVSGVAGSKSLTMTNNCSYTVWPGRARLRRWTARRDSTFELAPGESRAMRMRVPTGGNCARTRCVVDLNAAWPVELRVTSAATGNGAVACKSACQAFGSAQYCCTGEYGNPSNCVPTAYSQFFTSACPRAFSYAYDSAASTFTCGGGDTTYTIIFCPSTIDQVREIWLGISRGDSRQEDGTVVANTGGNQFSASACGVVAGTLSVLAVVMGAIFGCFRYIIKRRAQRTAAAGEK